MGKWVEPRNTVPHSPLRVAHVGNFRLGEANGVYATVAGLARHLPAAQVEVEIWHLARKVSVPGGRVVDGVEVLDLPRFRPDKAALVRLPAATEAVLVERAKSVQVIHLHSVYQAENIAIDRLGLGRPMVVTPHGGYSPAVTRGRRRIPKLVWRRFWEDALLGRAAVLHAVSGPELRELRIFRPGADVRLLPNALDACTLGERSRADPAGPFVFLGRLAVEHKGLDLLIDGYAQAVRRNSSLPCLVIAGPDWRGGAMALARRVRRLGMDGRVTFPGPVYGPGKAALLSSARCFVHTSRWEGFPFAVLEAMGQGLPVLVTDGTNMADVVRQHDSGIAVGASAGDIALGLEVMGMLSENELRRRGDAALRTVREHYTWEVVAPAMAKVYREIAR